MTKVHPEELVVKMSVEMDSKNANNNNEPDKEIRSSKSKDVDIRNESLYRPGIFCKDEIPRPITSTTSIANGRRLLVKGNKSLYAPPQEFLEAISSCFSAADTIYIRKVYGVWEGFLGFQIKSSYEVLNENKVRICVLGLGCVSLLGLQHQFVIANPFGVDAFTFKSGWVGPDSVSGPGIISYNVFFDRYTTMSFVSDKTWYKLDFGWKGILFPHWVYPFCGKCGSGPDFRFRNALDKSKVLARVTRDDHLGGSKDPIMKIKFSHSLATSQRIILFSASLYAFYYHFIPRGRFTSAVICTAKLTLLLTIFAFISFFIIAP